MHSVYLDENTSDMIIWTLEPSGVFSCKLFRRKMITDFPMVPVWKVMWVIDVPIKIKTFMGMLLQGRLSVRDKLIRLNLLTAHMNYCPFCGESEEYICHLSIHFQRIGLIWYKVASF